MNELILNNTISQLKLENETVNRAIWKSLRFRDKGYFHTRDYKLFIQSHGKHGWDGFVNFYSLETGKFPTGLLPEILKALNSLKIYPNLIDNRTKKIDNLEITPDMLSDYNDRYGNPIVLYDYQCDLANKAWKYERGIIEAATASGKTLMFTAMIKSIPPNTPTLVLFRAKTLTNQTFDEFKKFGIQNIGKINGDCFDPNLIMCANIQSVHKYEDLLDKFEILIADECHEFATNLSVNLFKKMTKCRYRFGFSATPWNKGDDIKKYRLKGWFGPVLGKVETKELQNKTNAYGEKILSDCICYFHEISSPTLYANDYKSAYELGVVQNKYLHNKIKEIVDKYESGRIVTVVERLEQGDRLAQNIPGSYWVSGSDNDEQRKFAIEKLQTSSDDEKNHVIATRIFQTGINLFVHAVINAAGYRSYIMTKQRIGRGLRPAKDKEKLEYHDFYYTNNDYLEKHSKERIKWLKKEGHPIIFVDTNGKETKLC